MAQVARIELLSGIACRENRAKMTAMKRKALAAWAVLMVAGLLLPGWAPAQSTGTVADAFQIARTVVAPDLQTKVVSVYGVGEPIAIQKWYIIFYDPTLPSHGRAVCQSNDIVNAGSIKARSGGRGAWR